MIFLGGLALGLALLSSYPCLGIVLSFSGDLSQSIIRKLPEIGEKLLRLTTFSFFITQTSSPEM